MKKELFEFFMVAVTSIIIVYVFTLFLDNHYEMNMINNNTLSTSNKKITATEKKDEIIQVVDKVEDNKIDENSQEDEQLEEVTEQVLEEEKIELYESKPDQNNNVTLESTETESIGQKIVDYAVQFVGNPYVYGGNSLTEGTDCSGFVKLIFENFGISLPRTTDGQAQSGYYISLENRQPGDIISYGYNGTATHSALYIGNDKVVHAATPSQGIIYGPLYMMPIIAIRRVI